MKKRLWFIVPVVLGALLILPLTAAAATNTEILALMNGVIQGILSAGKDAYCAAGVAAFCP